MGALTRSRLDRAVVARYFSFLIISQLIIFTLIGVIFSELPSVSCLLCELTRGQTRFSKLSFKLDKRLASMRSSTTSIVRHCHLKDFPIGHLE